MKAKHKRLIIIICFLAAGALAATLILQNFRSNLVFFFAPSELDQLSNTDRVIRIGGLVVEDSVKRINDGAILTFDISDGASSVTVRYEGLPPALFREGQGMVAKGTFNPETNRFNATELLAKHDENYMPPEVARALKESGTWQGDTTQ